MLWVYIDFFLDILHSLPDISKWNTSKLNNICNLFFGCSANMGLIFHNYIPYISKWNTINVFTMSNMFNSLKVLPNIGKWNTAKVQGMNYMFKNYLSLLYLPDISKWDISCVSKMNFIFIIVPLYQLYLIFQKRISQKM